MVSNSEKVAFVAGLTGSSVIEIQGVVSLSLAAHFAWKVTQKAIENDNVPVAVRFLLDFALTVLPMILAFTISWITPILVVLFVGYGLALWALMWYFGQSKSVIPSSASSSSSSTASLTPQQRALMVSLGSNRKPFLDVYRTLMMVSTCIAILAVDFPVFPRRFAKTETYGTSLMDVGVGSFVLVNSLTVGNSMASGRQTGNPLWHSIKASAPLVILGLARLVSVKAVDYQEHVSEYGVHWNFFFTLAALPLMTMAARMIVRKVSYLAYAGIAVVLAYQVALSLYGLEDYILEAPRIDLISMNKEGIFSVCGYFAIFAIGVQLGVWLLKHRPFEGWWKSVWTLLVLDAVLWLLWLYCEYSLHITTSRRLANLPYVIWTFAYNLPFLAGFLLIDLVLGYSKPGVLYSAINRNQLAVFLLANVLTGLVNMSINTIRTSDPIALVIIILYMIVVSLAATIADQLNVTLKFW